MPARDLPDINVWLALADPDHEHHDRACGYWNEEAAPHLAFCRVSMLGFLRLLTHPKVMRGDPFTSSEAWLAYHAFRALPEVTFLSESSRIDSIFQSFTDEAKFIHSRWTDAWLAAYAITTDARIVSFDSDFRTFPGLSFLHLKSAVS